MTGVRERPSRTLQAGSEGIAGPEPAWWRRQFGLPSGFVGSLCGHLMAVSNRDINRLAVDSLAIQPQDHVLEIGCAHGRALRRMAELADRGRAVGVDPSETMLRQARRRNRALIRAGRVAVEPGGISRLPFASATFDKVGTVNTVYLWPSPEGDLREVRRVLKPGGRLAIAFRGRRPGQEGGLSALSDEDVARLVSLLERLEFSRLETRVEESRGRQNVCVLGSR